MNKTKYFVHGTKTLKDDVCEAGYNVDDYSEAMRVYGIFVKEFGQDNVEFIVRE